MQWFPSGGRENEFSVLYITPAAVVGRTHTVVIHTYLYINDVRLTG